MKKLVSTAALIGFSLGLITQANALVPGSVSGFKANDLVWGKEDCQEDEKWNEETQQCEKKEQ